MSDELLQLLTAYVDGELDRRQRKQLARLLEKSKEARRMLRRLQADRNALHALRRQHLPEDYSQKLVAKLKPHNARPIAAKANVFRTWWPAAAAAAIILAIGLGTSVLVNDLMRGNRQPENVIAKSQLDDEKKVATDTKGQPIPPDASNGIAKNDAPTADDLKRFSKILDGWKSLTRSLRDGARQIVPSDAPDLALLPNLGGGPKGGLEFSDPPAVLTFPPGPAASAFKTIDGVKLALFLDPKSIDSTKLAERLKQDPIHHIDLACSDGARTFERLQAACRVAGIRLVTDSELSQRLAKKQAPPVMLYLENTNPDLVLKLMNALKDQEVKAEAAKKGDSVIDSIMVQPLDEAGRKRLADALGVAPATLTPMPVSPSSPSPARPPRPGLDPTKPIADGTIKSLEKLASKGKEPTAIALVYYPNRSRVPASKELKQFQDSRVGLESGAIHVVFFVRVNRG